MLWSIVVFIFHIWSVDLLVNQLTPRDNVPMKRIAIRKLSKLLNVNVLAIYRGHAPPPHSLDPSPHQRIEYAVDITRSLCESVLLTSIEDVHRPSRCRRRWSLHAWEDMGVSFSLHPSFISYVPISLHPSYRAARGSWAAAMACCRRTGLELLLYFRLSRRTLMLLIGI